MLQETYSRFSFTPIVHIKLVSHTSHEKVTIVKRLTGISVWTSEHCNNDSNDRGRIRPFCLDIMRFRQIYATYEQSKH